MGLLATVLTVSVASCGEDSSSQTRETTTAFPVEIVTADFPTRQRLGETTLLRLGVRNTGEKTIPSLTATISVGGEQGRNSRLPFGVRDAQPGLAQPDRPVWVLSAGYPRLAGSGETAGAQEANQKTFDFGPLEAGATTEVIWKVSAVRTGTFDLLYEIGAGREGRAIAETAAGTEAGGSFTVRVTEVPPDTVVTDSGEVKSAPQDPTDANR